MKGSWPQEIRLRSDRRSLDITFKDGQHFSYPSPYLRVESPAADAAMSTEKKKLLMDVLIHSLEPVGNYAIRLIFSDGHSTGLYSWAYLYALGQNFSTKWRGYFATQNGMTCEGEQAKLP